MRLDNKKMLCHASHSLKDGERILEMIEHAKKENDIPRADCVG
jgi:hypothetical protein